MIEINSYSKRYKKNNIVQNVNIIMNENKINFLLGKNGCGKTTLIKCLCQLEGYEGKIIFDNKDYSAVRNECFVLWDDTPFYMELSGIENLRIFTNHKIKKKIIYDIVKPYIDDKLLKKKSEKLFLWSKEETGFSTDRVIRL